MDSFWSLLRYSVPPNPTEHSDLSHFADTNFEVQYLLAPFSQGQCEPPDGQGSTTLGPPSPFPVLGKIDSGFSSQDDLLLSEEQLIGHQKVLLLKGTWSGSLQQFSRPRGKSWPWLDLNRLESWTSLRNIG